MGQLGPKRLHEVVFDLWTNAEPIARTTVEYLDSEHVGNDVLDILRAVQIAVGAVVANRQVESGRLAIYSVHAEYLAAKVLKIIPVGSLPRSLRGTRLEVDLGM